MRRREFIAGLGGAAAWPLATRGQQAQRMRRVGVLFPTILRTDADALVDAFKRGLAELDWTEGRNIRFTERYATDNNEMAAKAAELARSTPDAIFVGGSLDCWRCGARARTYPLCLRGLATRSRRVSFPVCRTPAAVSPALPLASPVSTTRLDLLKKLAPSLERFAFLYDPDEPESTRFWGEIEAAAPSLGLRALKVPVRNAEEIERAIMTLTLEPGSGLYVAGVFVNLRNRDLIAMLALRYRLPAMYMVAPHVESGGLASYGPDLIDLYRRAASYVDRILRGEKPRDLPVQRPTRFELVLNLKTARAIALDVPVNVLTLADKVIE